MVKPRRKVPPVFTLSVINRCNVLNIIVSLGLLFLFWRWSTLPPPKHAEHVETVIEQLDPDLIDEVVWPTDPQQQKDMYDMISTYGPGGVNYTRALLLRGGIREWSITDSISLQQLNSKYPNLVGTVTISPTPVFTLFTNSTEQQYADKHLTAAQVPAKLENMEFQAFKRRIAPSPRRRLPNMYYPGKEYYYWSGQPPPHLGHQPERPPVSCLAKPSQTSDEPLHVTTPRLRVTAKGSIHVMHFDTSPSLLVQLKGHKLVTLIPADQVAYTYPYPRGHLLFRRSRIDLQNPDYEKYPLSRNLKPTELVMNPGDVLTFPPQTCHQTRTLTDNVSMSFRFKPFVDL